MKIEARQASGVIQRQFAENKLLWQELQQQIQQRDIQFAVTVARGSSDHAATFHYQ